MFRLDFFRPRELHCRRDRHNTNIFRPGKIYKFRDILEGGSTTLQREIARRNNEFLSQYFFFLITIDIEHRWVDRLSAVYRGVADIWLNKAESF